MQNATADVKSDKVLVGEAKYPVYESTSEAAAAEGEDKLLGLLNAQIRTNAMNAIRQAANPSVSKIGIKLEVMTEMTTDKVLSFAGDKAALQEYVETEAERIYAERKAASPVAATTEPDDDEE